MRDSTENAPPLRGVFYGKDNNRLAVYGPGGSSHSPCHRVSA